MGIGNVHRTHSPGSICSVLAFLSYFLISELSQTEGSWRCQETRLHLPFWWLHQGAAQRWKVSSHLWQMCLVVINTCILEMVLRTDSLLFRWETEMWGSVTAGNLVSYWSAINQLINRLLFSNWMANAHSFGTLSCQMSNNNNKVYVSWLSSALKPVAISCIGTKALSWTCKNNYHLALPDGEDMEDYFFLQMGNKD